MFKRFTSNSVIVTLTSWVLLTQHVFAQNTSVSGTQSVSLFGFNVLDFINFVLATIANTALGIMNLWVAITGALFTVSINITLHIKDFVDNTQGIYLLWETIRDLSGIFIIFMLLYASIRIIIGKDEKIGPMIANIVIAGVLINFSFFITSLLIDASNIVSLAIYKGIVATPQVTLNKQTSIESLTSEALNGGADNSLSDIFMDKLQIQSVYKPTNLDIGNTVGGATSVLVKTIIQGVVGCVIMFTVGMSFLIASIAFIIRLVYLILILGFSPIWFASWILPSLKDRSSEFTEKLKNQLVFMPVYMLLLYAALTVLKNSTVFSTITSTSGVGWQTGFIVLAVNDFIIIFLLNMPLATAIAMSGHVGSLVKKWDAGKVFKNVGGFAGGWVGVRGAGKLAASVDKKLEGTRIGNSLLGRDIRSATTGALAKNKMGYSRSFEELKKAQGEVKKKGTEIDRKTELDTTIANPAALPIAYKNTINKMNEKEKLSLGTSRLKNVAVLKNLKSSDFEAIKKSEDFSDEDKRAISDQRVVALGDAVMQGQTDVVKHMVDNMDGKELMKLNTTLLTSSEVVKNLKTSQLKTMDDEGLDSAIKINIGSQILAATTPHKSVGFIRKNQGSWS